MPRALAPRDYTVIELDGTVQTWNQAAERVFGRRACEMIGQPFSVTEVPGWRPSFAHVFDFTATTLELSHDDVRALARAPRVFEAPQIFVAPAGSVQFGLARMFEIYSDGSREVHVVESMDAAREILRAR